MLEIRLIWVKHQGFGFMRRAINDSLNPGKGRTWPKWHPLRAALQFSPDRLAEHPNPNTGGAAHHTPHPAREETRCGRGRRTLDDVIDPAMAGFSVPRPRQLHDVQQSCRYPTHEYQLDPPSFQWPRRVPCLAVGFKPDTPLTRSAEPLVPIDRVKPYQRLR